MLLEICVKFHHNTSPEVLTCLDIGTNDVHTSTKEARMKLKERLGLAMKFS